MALEGIYIKETGTIRIDGNPSKGLLRAFEYYDIKRTPRVLASGETVLSFTFTEPIDCNKLEEFGNQLIEADQRRLNIPLTSSEIPTETPEQ